MKKRQFGLLMPISCLPSSEGIGTLGQEAKRFIDFIKESGGSLWQTLPLVPTGYGDSPYQSCCSFALNYYFIDLKILQEKGLLTEKECEIPLKTSDNRVDYSLQYERKIPLLEKAFSRFDCEEEGFRSFVGEGKYHDFAEFMTLKRHFQDKPWTEWEKKYRKYDKKTVLEFLKENEREYLFWLFTQYEFLEEWKVLRAYAKGAGVEIMGDIPLYLSYDSVEMWKYGQEIFLVDEERKPSFVAGVPPDAFSEDGQLWGNPLYNWARMKKDGYSWWNERLKRNFELFDSLRIDHFRGFDRFYAVPYGEVTAKRGSWRDGPKADFFLDKKKWKIIAEDLGVVDDGVISLMKEVGYPGMKILQFAFDGNPQNEHKPSGYGENFVCYTGTHDNATLLQYIEELPKKELAIFKKDLKEECKKFGFSAVTTTAKKLCDSVVKLAFFSPARILILPPWDILRKGKEARMNLPATVSTQNWSFRIRRGELNKKLSQRLKKLAVQSNRQ